jgi:glyoxylase-like metal-dependent hydrolase (beta-lactamase superfamily II)
MPPNPPAPVFKRDFDPRHGEPVAVAPDIVRIVAPNTGAYTFTGTNSYLIGKEKLFVVDPGPDRADHRDNLLKTIAGRPVEAVLLTHTHHDHSADAQKLATRLDAPIWFAGWYDSRRAGFRPNRVLAHGDRLALGDLALEGIATPGHCDNHLAFGLVGSPHLLSGDHVMGWSSTVLSTRPGALADYLASLDRLIAAPYDVYCPGHGDLVPEGRAHAQALKAHRLHRNEQILAAVADGARTQLRIIRAVYPDLGRHLLPAAYMTVTAHLDHLVASGRLRRGRRWFRTEYQIAA